MKKCTKCSTTEIKDSAAECPKCGSTLDSMSESIANNDDKDTMDFVITEAAEDDREFVGYTDDAPADKDSNEDIVPKNDMDPSQETEAPDEISPIGQSSPFLPLDSDNPNTEDSVSGSQTDDEALSGAPSDKLQKLSDEEVKNIEANLYAGDPYVGDREKAEIIDKLNETSEPFGNTPITPPVRDNEASPSADSSDKDGLPAPKMAERGRGAAYFYRNYIELLGSQELHAGDEMTIDSRAYELKAKRIDPRFKYGGMAAAFAVILVMIGTLFVSDIGLGGNGRIVGVVLHEDGRPVTQKVTVRFPELNKSVQSDTEGLFSSDGLPNGTHLIEFVWGGVVQGTDYATVADGKITMISLHPPMADLAGNELPTQSEPIAAEAPTLAADGNTIAKAKTTSSTSSKNKSSRSSSAKYSKLALEANVEGARLTLSEKVIGAGNLTFERLKPGRHNYEVALDGYKPVTGNIELTPGKTAQLTVELTPLNSEDKVQTFSSEDYYRSGMTAYHNGDYYRAVSDHTQAVDADPSYARAYLARGEAYASLNNKDKAYNDFLRSAEISRFNKAYASSVAAYTRAIDMNKKAIPAWLGRGLASLANGEDRAAIIDFETVNRMDKRNAQAYSGLGQARFRQGSFKKAIKHFKNARSLDAINPLTHQYLMLSYLAVDDTKNLRKSYKKFISVANDREIDDLHSDSRFAAVVRIVEMDK
ncbi:MAG: tetratricopeptide repeat protein [candidate division Zixibacteria bacterium]|nr:tetratricopeptide repeat protein [candidate division Zixibacteria bacterium]